MTFARFAVPAAVAFLLAILLSGIDEHWYVRSKIKPSDAGIVITMLTLYGASWSAWSRDKTKTWSRIASAGFLFALYCTLDGPDNQGDTWARELYYDTRNDAHLSSLLAHGIYFLASFLRIPLQFVPPLAGGLSAFVFFRILDKLFSDRTVQSFAAMLLYAGAVLHIVFLYDFIEVTSVSVPALMAFFYFAHGYLEAKGRAYDGRRALMAATMLGLAATIHGMNAFLLPLLPVMVFLRRARNREWGVAAKECAAGLVTIAVIALSSVGLLTLLNYDVVPGDIHGGGDDTFFIRFFGETGGMERFTAFSYRHFLEIANIAGASFPLVWLVPFLAARRAAFASFSRHPFNILTAVGTLGFFAYVFLFNFDLGYARDLDLMVAMSTPLILFALPLLVTLVTRPRVLLALAYVQIAASWFYIGSYLKP